MALTVRRFEIPLPSGRTIRPLAVRCPECGSRVSFERTSQDDRHACLMSHGTLGHACPGSGMRVTLRWPKETES